jgi:hypothetical protein
MRIATSAWAGVALLALTQAAQAATVVQGKYVATGTTHCNASFTASTDTFSKPGGTGPGVKPLTAIQPGEFGTWVGTITFPTAASASGNFSIALIYIVGRVNRVNGSGSVVTQQSQALSGTFSVAASTLTLDPATEPPMVMRAVYGDLLPSGANKIARTIYMVRKEDNNCVQSIQATRQQP